MIAYAANRGRPFRLLEYEIPRGAAKSMELPIARLPTGAWEAMPVTVIHGHEPGPTVWLSGAVHGDELNGVITIRRLIKILDPAKLKGTVLAVPIVNVFGITLGSRYLPDRRDLNRSFPGSATGSLAARLANFFFTKIAKRCDLGLDFHTASNGRFNLPQIRCDLNNANTRIYAQTFGAPIILHSELRDGSLRAASRKEAIDVLLFEGGEAGRLDETAIDVAVEGTLRVLHALEMWHYPFHGRSAPQPAMSRKSLWVRAPRSGFSMIQVTPGQRVRSGDLMAKIDDGSSPRFAQVRSRMDGIVISVLRTALVHRGDALIHVAETEG